MGKNSFRTTILCLSLFILRVMANGETQPTNHGVTSPHTQSQTFSVLGVVLKLCCNAAKKSENIQPQTH